MRSLFIGMQVQEIKLDFYGFAKYTLNKKAPHRRRNAVYGELFDTVKVSVKSTLLKFFDYISSVAGLSISSPFSVNREP